MPFPCPVQLVRIAASGGSSACCMFGQTGSGKTHTMKAVLETVAGMLFPGGAPPHAGDGSGGASSSRTAALLRQLASECTINLACYEVCGKACHDLLAGRSKVKIQEDARGSFQVGGAESGRAGESLPAACADQRCTQA